jgi:hypothetical protein
VIFALESGTFALESVIFTLESGTFTLGSVIFTLESGIFALGSGTFALGRVIFTLESGTFALGSVIFARSRGEKPGHSLERVLSRLYAAVLEAQCQPQSKTFPHRSKSFWQQSKRFRKLTKIQHFIFRSFGAYKAEQLPFLLHYRLLDCPFSASKTRKKWDRGKNTAKH